MLSTPNFPRPWRRLDAAARTHVGKVRANNEDALLCKPEAGVFAVIDGMGGEESGEVAAAIAVATLANVAANDGPAGQPSETLLARALSEARDRILADGARTPAHANMGAVATALRVEDNGRFIGVAHVGDTRLYRVDRRGVKVLTTDHVQPLPDNPERQAVARDLGRKQMPEGWVETGRHAVSPGDLLVLCSDGLHGPVEAKELEAALLSLHSRKVDADSAAQKLVALALARGGPDNVTVVVVRVGRFRRGRRVPRLNMALAMPVLALLVTLAIAVGLWGNGQAKRAAMLPVAVMRDTVFKNTDPIDIPLGTRTEIAEGRLLDVRGAQLTGVDWTLHLGAGSHLRIDRSVLTLSGLLRVELEPGAEMTLVNSRVAASTLTLSGPVPPSETAAHIGLIGVVGHVGSVTREGSLVVEASEVYGDGLISFLPEPAPEPAHEPAPEPAPGPAPETPKTPEPPAPEPK